MSESQALVPQPPLQPKQMLTNRLVQHVSNRPTCLVPTSCILLRLVQAHERSCDDVTWQADHVEVAARYTQTLQKTPYVCAQLYGDSMRYKPEDAVVLRAMQDMKRLDDHTGSGG
jgi:hypothetical protein